MNVLIISGGSSSERKISLISARVVKKALEVNNHTAQIFDLKKGYKELKKRLSDFEVVFPVLHGEEGEGGDLQKFLAKSGKPFVGGSWKGFKQGWYKIPFKKFCQKNNILTAEWRKIRDIKDIIKFGFPCVLKSSNGGSSREVVILNSEKALNRKTVSALLNSENQLLVERFLPGIEVTVGILENQALPVLEIVPPKGSWFDYKNKYSGVTREIPHAPSISKKLQKEAQETALKIHQKLKLGQYSRIDFIVSEIPYVLEVNTIPGLTSQSLFPKAALAAGITFPQLVGQLINHSLIGYFV